MVPLSLRLQGKSVVVVGGGTVATRRTHTWRSAGAEVTVISPTLTDQLAAAAARGDIVWHERTFQPGDVEAAWLVQTATGVPGVDDAVFAEAEANRIWCLKGGDPDTATAWSPATAVADDVQVAVSGGGDSGRAIAIRDALAASLDAGDFPLRHRTHHPGGYVALVGGGPGDPDLITTRGRRLLAQADVVVFDRLAPQSLLESLPIEVELIDVGKRPDHHPVPQEHINQLLIDRARAGNVVVRLKGGDPFVFGRGGEERLACEEAGVEVEVVPGVTSAIAAAAAVGIPVTHRGMSRGFTVLTGHEDLGDLPVRRDHTLVLLMGVQRLAETARALVAAGHNPTTPAALIERGCLPDQRLTVATLATIAERAAEVGATPPAITVIGEVVALAPTDTSA